MCMQELTRTSIRHERGSHDHIAGQSIYTGLKVSNRRFPASFLTGQARNKLLGAL